MDVNKNSYTFTFSAILVVVVAAILAFAAESLKPMQKANERIEKMQNILASVGVEAEPTEAEALFNQYITNQVVIGADGKIKDTEISAFDIDVLKDYKSGLSKIYSGTKDDPKAREEQLMAFNDNEGASFPLFIYEGDGKKAFIVPLVGKGLWGPIWGYVAFGEDMNTVVGSTFDHKTETPGLGAEIKEKWFQERFIDKQIFDGSGVFVSIEVVKPGKGTEPKHSVDGITGGTITSKGVGEMIERTLGIYVPYFQNNQQAFNHSN